MQEEEIKEAFETIYELMEVILKKIEVLSERLDNDRDNQVQEQSGSDAGKQLPFDGL